MSMILLPDERVVVYGGGILKVCVVELEMVEVCILIVELVSSCTSEEYMDVFPGSHV